MLNYRSLLERKTVRRFFRQQFGVVSAHRRPRRPLEGSQEGCLDDGTPKDLRPNLIYVLKGVLEVDWHYCRRNAAAARLTLAAEITEMLDIKAITETLAAGTETLTADMAAGTSRYY